MGQPLAPIVKIRYTVVMSGIQIEISHPRLLLLALVAVAWLAMRGGAQTPVEAEAVGSPIPDRVQAVAQAESDVRRLREQQALLVHQEDILRAQLAGLQQAVQDGAGDQVLLAALAEATGRLRALLADKRAIEQELLGSLQQLWNAQGAALKASQRARVRSNAMLPVWPVEPKKGISAKYLDPSYESRFGLPHEGIDIPTPQGTPIAAAANGVVVEASDNGYGFSSVTLRSDDGIAYMYGHVTAIFVEEGQRVHAGDIVAKSGGLPGTRGAGMLTTGAHLHMEVVIDGKHQDPLLYLPPLPEISPSERRFWKMGEAKN